MDRIYPVKKFRFDCVNGETISWCFISRRVARLMAKKIGKKEWRFLYWSISPYWELGSGYSCIAIGTKGNFLAIKDE